MRHTSQHRKEICIGEIRSYVRTSGTARDFRLMEFAISDLERFFRYRKRYSGEPMILHSLRVARLLCQANQDAQTVIAGLLHDTIEDTLLTREDIQTRYGGWDADTVEALSKTSDVTLTHQKLINAADRDTRAMIIKTYDRLDNMRELEWLPEPKQNRISAETIDFYVPMARQIGVSSLVTSELKSLSTTHLL